MPLYRITEHGLDQVEATRFADNGLREREDLQRLLRDAVESVVPGSMVVAEEFGKWEDARRRIDLLCLDRDAKLVVVELKRTRDGGHMELQAIRYAAMVARMTWEQLVDAHEEYLGTRGRDPREAEAALLEFLDWNEPDDSLFPADVRIVLASADFSTEITTAVLWLNERDLDIRCVRLVPHEVGGDVLLHIEQCLPLPSAEEYQVRLREKAISKREQGRSRQAWTGAWAVNVGDSKSPHRSPHRSWEDCREYGFLLAGGGEKWSRQIRRLGIGDLVFAYATGSGYVGAGRVVGAAKPIKDFVPPQETRKLIDLRLQTPPNAELLDDLAKTDWCVPVEWLSHRDRGEGVLSDRAYRGTVNRIRRQDLVDALRKEFDIEDPVNA